LILFLYNTGARAQEVADLRAEHLDLGEHPIMRLHGKGGNRQVRLRSAGIDVIANGPLTTFFHVYNL
jgi:integrase